MNLVHARATPEGTIEYEPVQRILMSQCELWEQFQDIPPWARELVFVLHALDPDAVKHELECLRTYPAKLNELRSRHDATAQPDGADPAAENAAAEGAPEANDVPHSAPSSVQDCSKFKGCDLAQDSCVRRLSKQYHPDRGGDADDFKKLQECHRQEKVRHEQEKKRPVPSNP